MNELTSPEYWDGKYAGTELQDVDPSDFRQRPHRVLIEKVESLGLTGRKVLEIGAGGSAILANLAERNPGAEFHGLDYSEAGCRQLAELAARHRTKVTAHHADMFAPPSGLKGRFDVVYSLGVVEHFESLPSVLKAQSYFLAPGGLMFTMIPNLSGLIGRLMRRYAPDIMDMHKVHGAPALLAGHAEAGLEPLSSGYLCSTNFGVLSACFRNGRGPGWHAYLWLSRLSKAAWLFEDRLFRLPGTRALSPYIYVTARAGQGSAE